MKFLRKNVLSLAVGLALVGIGSAQAVTITNSAGSFSNWGGFDWAANGTAVVDGFDPTALNSTFDLTYWASAAQLLNTAGQGGFGSGFAVANAGILGGDYEYTIRVKLNETSTCLAFIGPICGTATFDVNFGSFEIFYSTTVNADQVTGAGITDGTLLLAGTILAQAGGGFDVIAGGNATLQATVDTTNGTFINPALSTSTATTTLQIGSNITSWLPPTGLPGDGGVGTGSLPAGAILLQADANQSFGSVPEPGTIALAGLALLGLGLSRRAAKRA